MSERGFDVVYHNLVATSLGHSCDALRRIRSLIASLRSESAEAHSEEGWGFEPMAKLKAGIADRIDAALNGGTE